MEVLKLKRANFGGVTRFRIYAPLYKGAHKVKHVALKKSGEGCYFGPVLKLELQFF